MTPEEKHAQMTARNGAIVAYYAAGHSLRECASKFKLGRQRVLQILQAAGAWRPHVKTKRTKFIGVNVTAEAKDALQAMAKSEHKSVSRYVADRVDEMVK